MACAQMQEMCLWAGVVLGTGYPEAHIVEYLRAEYGLDFEEAEAVAMRARWAGCPIPLRE